MIMQFKELHLLETFGTSTASAMAWKSDNSGLVAISGTKVMPDQIWITYDAKPPRSALLGEVVVGTQKGMRSGMRERGGRVSGFGRLRREVGCGLGWLRRTSLVLATS